MEEGKLALVQDPEGQERVTPEAVALLFQSLRNQKELSEVPETNLENFAKAIYQMKKYQDPKILRIEEILLDHYAERIWNPLDPLNQYSLGYSGRLMVHEGNLSILVGEGVSPEAIQFILNSVRRNPKWLAEIYEDGLASLAFNLHKIRGDQTADHLKEILMEHFVERHPTFDLVSIKKFFFEPSDSNIRDLYICLNRFVHLSTLRALKSYEPEWLKLVNSMKLYKNGFRFGALFTDDLVKMRDILEAVRKMDDEVLQAMITLFRSRVVEIGLVEGTIRKCDGGYFWVSPNDDCFFASPASSKSNFIGRIQRECQSAAGHFIFSVITSVQKEQRKAIVEPVAKLVEGAVTAADIGYLKNDIDSIPTDKRLSVLQYAKFIDKKTPFIQRGKVLRSLSTRDN